MAAYEDLRMKREKKNSPSWRFEGIMRKEKSLDRIHAAEIQGVNLAAKHAGLKRKRRARKASKFSRKPIDAKNGEIEKIIADFSSERVIFHYFKDRYAIMLLSSFTGDCKSISDVKKSPFGKLLKRPILKDVASKIGDGLLTKNILESFWPPEPEAYLITLGEWGKIDTGDPFLDNLYGNRFFSQTGRDGLNLVIQLNFSSKHNVPYKKLIRPEGNHPFEYELHPIAPKGYHTLAWSRIDLDQNRDEALIEEIQSDWIKLAMGGKATIETLETDDEGRRSIAQRELERQGLSCNQKNMEKYISTVLKPHLELWDEAILAATIWFLREQLGITRIFYHTFDSGNRIKGITYRKPPRSLYSSLPKRFCFQETEEIPGFLMESADKSLQREFEKGGLHFYLLDAG